MQSEIKKIKDAFSCDSKYKNFPDFITDINFPCFKGLVPGARVSFLFPLTVLVGENGCGKSSILQALENTPEGKSFTSRWFSTSVDPIPINPRPAYWYSYYNSDANMIVQVLNERIQKKDNPDYWEPARPKKKYGMKPFPSGKANTPGASGTRWNGTKRNVLYIDFRSELSAFDKYFYFGEKPNKKTIKTKQDYIRSYSKYLKKLFDKDIDENFLLRNKKMIEYEIDLTSYEIKNISEILDKNYTSIKLIKHRFYKQWGESVYFNLDKTNTLNFSGNYTEAFAGSGESAVVKLVHQIYSSKCGDLILLDEPEVSLHPGAQKRLLSFLLKQTLEKKLQIVISTHSPAIVEELPEEAIILLHQTSEGLFYPKCSIPAELAFQYIGQNNYKKPKIIVEDFSAKQLLLACLKLCDERASSSIDIIFHPGGAEDMFKEALIMSRLNVQNIYFIFDGDMYTRDIPDEKEISTANLDPIIEEVTGIKIRNLGFVADSGKQLFQIENEKRGFITFLKEKIMYLPLNTPEEIMWNTSKVEKPSQYNDSDYKERIIKWIKGELGEDVESKDVECYIKKLCNNLDENNEEIKEIITILKKILTNTNIINN